MKNKKAWLRIVEAFIAVILIASVLIVLYARTVNRDTGSEQIYNFQKTILDEIAADENLRRDVLEGKEKPVADFVKSRNLPGFEYAIRICDPGIICSLPGEYKGGVYSTERIISSTLEEYNPKKIKIFMWLE